MSKKYFQSTFTPVYPQKYKGTYPIIARSSWEYKAFMYLDRSNEVISWGSESIVIPYNDLSDNGNMHRYFPDLIFKVQNYDKTQTTYLVEIKPSVQCMPPIRGKKREHTFINECKTYAKNISKWQAAFFYAKSMHYKFVLWTEKGLIEVKEDMFKSIT